MAIYRLQIGDESVIVSIPELPQGCLLLDTGSLLADFRTVRAASAAGCGWRFGRVHVTEAACEALNTLLSRAAADRCLRLSTVQGNYRFIVDEPIEQDITYRYAERIVLAVSDTVTRDLWGITVDCTLEAGKRKLIFRKAGQGEPMDATRAETDLVPPGWRAGEHERLLAEIADIGRQIASLRGGSKSLVREQLHTLEAAKHEKWDAIRTLWAGDGGWHKKNGISPNGDAVSVATRAAE